MLKSSFPPYKMTLLNQKQFSQKESWYHDENRSKENFLIIMKMFQFTN